MCFAHRKCANRELSLSSFMEIISSYSFFLCVEPPSTILQAKYRLHCVIYYFKLAQIALVGPGIHPKNGQRVNFTRGPPCLVRSMFGDSVNMKPPLTSVSFRGLPLPTFQLNDARPGASAEENGSKKKNIKQ